MMVELGPVTATDVTSWARFARRVIAETRLDPGDMTGVVSDDLIEQWSKLIDEWETAASQRETFRWSTSIDTEMAEFLLHGLERGLLSPDVQARVTSDEAVAHRPFTMHVVTAFVDALVNEGVAHEHYADQVRASLASWQV